MRSFVVALMLAVSPIGPAVCEVVCTTHAAGHHDVMAMPSCHESAPADGLAFEADHDCAHSDDGLVIVGASAPFSVAPAIVSVASLGINAGAMSSVARLPIGSTSPPHSPPIRSLRI